MRICTFDGITDWTAHFHLTLLKIKALVFSQIRDPSVSWCPAEANNCIIGYSAWNAKCSSSINNPVWPNNDLYPTLVIAKRNYELCCKWYHLIHGYIMSGLSYSSSINCLQLKLFHAILIISERHVLPPTMPLVFQWCSTPHILWCLVVSSSATFFTSCWECAGRSISTYRKLSSCCGLIQHISRKQNKRNVWREPTPLMTPWPARRYQGMLISSTATASQWTSWCRLAFRCKSMKQNLIQLLLEPNTGSYVVYTVLSKLTTTNHNYLLEFVCCI